MQSHKFASHGFFDWQMLTVCIVSKSMDMETMLSRSESFDFSCQLHRGGLGLTDEDKMMYQAITNTQKSRQSQVV